MVLDPIVHGVAGHQLDGGHGIAHAALQHGIDVGEEEEIGIAIRVGNFGLERRKDVELGVMGFGLVQVFEIRALPEKAFAGGMFNAASVNVAGGKNGFLLGAKVLAHDGDDAHIGEEAGGERKVSCSAAQTTLAATSRSFNGIVSNAADDGDGHVCLSCSIN